MKTFKELVEKYLEDDGRDLDDCLVKLLLDMMSSSFSKWESFGVIFENKKDIMVIIHYLTLQSIPEKFKDQIPPDKVIEGIDGLDIRFSVPMFSELEIDNKEASGQEFAKIVANDLRKQIKEFFSLDEISFIRFKYVCRSDTKFTKKQAASILYKNIGTTACMNQLYELNKIKGLNNMEFFNEDILLAFMLDDMLENYASEEEKKILTNSIDVEELDKVLDSYLIKKGIEASAMSV